MAQLTINQCQRCGKILAPGVTECGKCHTKHAMQPTVVNPLRFTAAQAADYRAQFQEQVAACPKDSNAQFAMGLTYLGLRNYELADEYLIKAVQLTPSNPDVYYYTALALFHHRSVMNLSKAEMDRIEEWLNTAIQMQPKRKYLILQMILRQGMSSLGINVDTDKLAPAELMNQARQTVQEEDEMVEIEQHVLVTDEKTQILLSKLTNQQEETEDFEGSPTIDEALAKYQNFCFMPRNDDNQYLKIATLADEEERVNFFNHIFFPETPDYLSKPGYLQPVWRTIWKGFIALIAWVIMIGVIERNDLIDTHGTRVETVQERIADLNTKKMTKQQIKDAKAKAQAGFEAETELDAQMRKLFYFYDDEEGKRRFCLPPKTEEQLAALPEHAMYCGIHKGRKGWLGVGLFFLIPLIWIIATFGRFASRATERRNISRTNADIKAQYEEDINRYKDRPTIADFKVFCALFAGPNNVTCIEKGDFVQEALRQAHISEKDIQNGNGKIFFSCYFMDTDADGNDTDNPEITLRDIVVRVCVAMRDSIVYMHGVWDTMSDQFPIFDQERLLYSQIANFRNVASYSTLEVISPNNSILTKIIYAYGDFPSLFQYQNLEPKDNITYSNTRTSDFNEFYNSLVKMHTAYCKS